MVDIHPEFVVDSNQHRKAVLLPVAEFDRIISELEELDDIRAYDAAKNGSQEKILFDQAVREIQEDHGK